MIFALAIQVQNLVSGFDKNGFQIKMVGPRLNQHFNHNKWFVLLFILQVQHKIKRRRRSRVDRLDRNFLLISFVFSQIFII
jgi:hypothetical protein